MTAKKLFLFILFILHYSFSSESCYAIDQKTIDSLQTELRKFEAHKKELGGKVTALTDSTKANLYYRLSVEMVNNNNDTAMYWAKECLSLSEKIGFKSGMALADGQIGFLYSELTDYAKALNYYERGLFIREQLGDKNNTAWFLNKMGNIYTVLSDYPKSLEYHQKALTINEQLGNQESIGSNYGNIGNIYFYLSDNNRALEYYKKALSIFEQIGNKNYVANILGNIGGIYIDGLHDYPKALEYLQKALAIHQEIKNPYGIAITTFNIGTIYGFQGHYSEELNNYLKALEIYQPLDSKNGSAMCYRSIGKYYLKHGDLQNALKNEQKGLLISLETGSKKSIKEAYGNLAAIDSAMNNFKEAFENHKLFMQYNDSIFNMEKDKRLTSLAMKYDFTKVQDSTKAVQDKKDKEVEVQKFRRNAILIGMAFIVIILVLVILLRTRIAKENRQKALEQERTRISKDLHDDLGSELSKISLLSDIVNLNTTAEDMKPHLANISRSSKAMVENMGDIIWIMNAKNDRLPNLVSYIRKYSMEFFETTAISCHIIQPEVIPDIQIEGDFRRNIFLVVKEALNNILKHSDADKVEIKFIINPHSFSITIHDNGKGIDESKLSEFGNGLINMEKRIKDINGKFSIKNMEGTLIEISIPV